MSRYSSISLFSRSQSPRAALLFVCVLFGYCALSQRTISIFYTGSGDTIKTAARILQEQLTKAGITIERSSGSFNYNGILLSHEPSKWKKQSQGLEKLGPEACVVTTTANSVLIIGNSQLAVRHGVFIYLEKLGFRYYFPNPDWYIIPVVKQLYPKFNYRNAPSFDHRRIWYGYGTGSKIADTNYDFWYMANRLGGSLGAVIGHSYDDIVARNTAAFKSHPEWLYPRMVNNVIPDNPKFDLANEELVQFVINDVLSRLRTAAKQGKPLKMITLCPSDGPGTCDSKACQRLGATITDRVYSLINRAARVVNKEFPGTWISGMSYSEYSAPPTKRLEPNTFVSIATAYNVSKYSTDELISEWSKKAGKVGIYDYLGLFAWDFDQPGQSQASQVDKVIRIIQKYYKLGAKGYDAETTPGAINTGLGHYLIARTLWDVNASTTTLKADFFANCFGKASTLMTGLWKEWQSYPYDIPRESDLAEWMDIIDEAGKIQQDPATQKRLDQVRTYLHYLNLYLNYRKTNADDDLIELLSYSYNTMDIGSISGYAALFVFAKNSKAKGIQFNDPEARYKKSNRDHSIENIQKLIISDRRKLQKKSKVARIAPARELKIAPVNSLVTGKKFEKFRGNTGYTGMHSFVMKLNNQSSKNFIDLSGGLVVGGGVSMPIVVSVFPYDGSPEVKPGQKPLLQYNYTIKVDTQRIDLSRLPKGVYFVTVDDPKKKFVIYFSPAISYSVIVTPNARLSAYTRFLWFYVPKGTTNFRIFKQIEVTLVSPTGRVIENINKKSEEIDIEVKAGEEGLWIINFLSGNFHIEGVPPFLGPDPERMLIPATIK